MIGHLGESLVALDIKLMLSGSYGVITCLCTIVCENHSLKLL